MSAARRLWDRVFGSPAPPAGPPPEEKPAGKPAPRRAERPPHRPSARYDAAETGAENYKHWANADALSAEAANSPAVRFVLRNRSRYERANNGYAKGLIRGRTNDTVGTGPRLQLDLPAEFTDPDFGTVMTTTPPDLARLVERRWAEWWEARGLTDKLRMLAEAEDCDGEGFGLFADAADDYPVRLSLRVFECDRVTTPDLWALPDGTTDGIEFDAAGEPTFYHVLRRHPGGTSPFDLGAHEYDRVPARQVVHLFDADRPEQARGVPLLTAALPLYAILRRYTLASLGAAEVGAMIAGVIENPNAPPDASGDDAPEFEAMDQIPFARNALLTLAGGQTAKAFDSKNPSPGYKEFKSEVLTEAGRAAGEMRNTATGSSAEYNYSSGRLDHLPRQRGIEVRRERLERKLLDRLFRAWLEEAVLVPGYLPAGLPPVAEWEWRWHWDGFPSIDPLKDANAVKVLKEIGLTTDAAELAKQGRDWREHYAQLAREKALRAELGIEPAPPKPAPGAPAPEPDGEEVPADG